MLFAIKQLVRESPIGPLALRVRDIFSSPNMRALRYRNEKYDREATEVMKRVLRSDSCCIDVGAHRGDILRRIVNLSPLGTHFAFEPLPDLAAFLRKTFPNVHICEVAVSDHSGTSSFVQVKNAAPYSGLRQRIYDRPDPILETIFVQVVTLDDVVPKDLPIAFIKLDIEGGEFHALRGATQLIRRSQPIIVFEAGPKSTGQYGVTPKSLHLLVSEELGYRLSTMHNWLNHLPPYDGTAFVQSWHNEQEFYFIAYP